VISDATRSRLLSASEASMATEWPASQAAPLITISTAATPTDRVVTRRVSTRDSAAVRAGAAVDISPV
jgi:hypothetical protein